MDGSRSYVALSNSGTLATFLAYGHGLNDSGDVNNGRVAVCVAIVVRPRGCADNALRFTCHWPGTQCEVVSPGGTIPIPAGLGSGDRFHLVFASSGTRDGTSGEIQNYNDFVQAVANTAGIGDSEGVSWLAISSTADVNAKENAVVSAPVYNTRGYTIDNTQMDLIAVDAEDMWDGSILNNIGWDETGEDAILDTWTSSLANGLAASVENGFAVDEFLGAPPSGLGGAKAWCGSPFSTTDTWIHVFNPIQTLPLSVYGLSEELLIAEPGLPGDFDGSNLVDLVDLNLVLFNWNQLGIDLPVDWSDQRPGDAENVGLPQLNDVLFNWNRSVSATVSVPNQFVPYRCCLAWFT